MRGGPRLQGSAALTLRKPASIGHALLVLCSLRTVRRVDDLASDSSHVVGHERSQCPLPRGRPFSSATGRDRPFRSSFGLARRPRTVAAGVIVCLPHGNKRPTD